MKDKVINININIMVK